MSNYSYERTLMGYLENLRTYMVTRPVVLGGVAGGGGGTGGPPGGFIGTLPQSRISYDTTEAETYEVAVSGYSLVDNLNRIRYRLSYIESSGVGGSGIGHIIQWNGYSYTPRAYLNFVGSGISISDDVDTTTVTVTGGGTGSSIDILMTQVFS